MDFETKEFITNVDEWIKLIRREINELKDIPAILEETVDNVQHNYELIYELKEQIQELQREIVFIKLAQVARGQIAFNNIKQIDEFKK